MIKIALVGKKAVGKTFVAWYLQTRHGFKNVRLDDAIVQFLRTMYKNPKYTRVVWEDRIRFYDALYKLDPEIHIRYLLRRLETTTRDVVVDDARYINEIKRLEEKGFVIIRIESPPSRARKLRTMKHAASDTIMLNEYFGQSLDRYSVDYSIYNDSRDATRASVDKILAKIVDKQRENPS